MIGDLITAGFALAALAILIGRSIRRERRLQRVYRRVLEFCDHDEIMAREAMYHEFRLPDGTLARPIDLTETDAQFDALNTTLGRAEHGVFG